MKTIKKLTTNPYTSHLQGLLKSRTSPNQRFRWTLHAEVTPPRIVSIRTIEGHLGRGGPKLGNRLVVQALIRFDTMQVCSDSSHSRFEIDPKVSYRPSKCTRNKVICSLRGNLRPLGALPSTSSLRSVCGMTYRGKLNSKCSKCQGKGWASGSRICPQTASGVQYRSIFFLYRWR